MTYTQTCREGRRILSYTWVDLSDATYDFTGDPFGGVKKNSMWVLRPNLRFQSLPVHWELTLETGQAFAVVARFAFFHGRERVAMLIAVPYMDGIVSVFIEAIEVVPGFFRPIYLFDEAIRFFPEQLQGIAASATALNALSGTIPFDFRGAVLREPVESQWFQKEGKMLSALAELAFDKGHSINRETTDEGLDGCFIFHLGNRYVRRVYFQAKSGSSHTDVLKDGTERFHIEKQGHINFWLSHAPPVLLILQDGTGAMRCADLHEALLRARETTPSIRSVRLATEPLNAETMDIWVQRFRQGYPHEDMLCQYGLPAYANLN